MSACLVTVVLLAASVACQAGVVQTTAGAQSGAVTVKDGALDVGGKNIPFDGVLYVLMDNAASPSGSPGAVRFRNGECWSAQIATLQNNKLSIRSPLVGDRELDVDMLAAVDFVGSVGAVDASRKGVLLRDKGEPLPGKLMWIDEKELAIDSPLGVLKLPRQGQKRYVFDKPAPATGTATALISAPAGTDEVTLIDGSVLAGQAKLVGAEVHLQHTILGTLKLPSKAVWSIMRRGAGAVYLAELEPSVKKALPLITKPMEPQFVDAQNPGAGASTSAPAYLKAVRMFPGNTLQYKVPIKAGQKAQLRATVAPLENARGEASVRITSGGKVLVEKTVAAGDKPAAISVDLPAADVTIEVNFGSRLLLPCGAVLADPLVLVQ